MRNIGGHGTAGKHGYPFDVGVGHTLVPGVLRWWPQ
jgi:hypothetical protein